MKDLKGRGKQIRVTIFKEIVSFVSNICTGVSPQIYALLFKANFILLTWNGL